MKHDHNKLRATVIVQVVAASTVIFGFAALAIDVRLIYSVNAYNTEHAVVHAIGVGSGADMTTLDQIAASAGTTEGYSRKSKRN
jgi:hypothetical protein